MILEIASNSGDLEENTHENKDGTGILLYKVNI